jgi:hypothetical protein
VSESGVAIYRNAYEEYQTALADIKALVADYIDAHPELDVTGEWRRMRFAFGVHHTDSWDFDADGESATFDKTTNRGLNNHVIVVKLADLEEN